MRKLTPIDLYTRSYRLAWARYDKSMENAKALLKKRRKTCVHKYTFYSDPSGNNDSYYECDYCGERK